MESMNRNGDEKKKNLRSKDDVSQDVRSFWSEDKGIGLRLKDKVARVI